jgi:hypothetical protein
MLKTTQRVLAGGSAAVPMNRLRENPYTPRPQDVVAPAFLSPRSFELAVVSYNQYLKEGNPVLDPMDYQWTPVSLSRYSNSANMTLVNPIGRVATVTINAPVYQLKTEMRVIKRDTAMKTMDINPRLAQLMSELYKVGDVLGVHACAFWKYNHEVMEWTLGYFFDEKPDSKQRFHRHATDWVILK